MARSVVEAGLREPIGATQSTNSICFWNQVDRADALTTDVIGLRSPSDPLESIRFDHHIAIAIADDDTPLDSPRLAVDACDGLRLLRVLPVGHI